MKKFVSVFLSLATTLGTAMLLCFSVPTVTAFDYTKSECPYNHIVNDCLGYYGLWSVSAGPVYRYVGKSETDKFAISYYDNYPDSDLPLVYLMIKKFGISKEKFTAACEEGNKTLRPSDSEVSADYYENCIFTSEIIEILYSGDENLIRKTLHRPEVFYFDGRLYTLGELAGLPAETLGKMRENGDLDEYLRDSFIMSVLLRRYDGGDMYTKKTLSFCNFAGKSYDPVDSTVKSIYQKLGQEPPFDLTATAKPYDIYTN